MHIGQIADMQLVNSSNLFAVDYDSWSATLLIEFHSERVYEYYGVPGNVVRQLLNAESPGRYFHEHIKHHYRYRRIQ